jgi:hypothetical protein
MFLPLLDQTNNLKFPEEEVQVVLQLALCC